MDLLIEVLNTALLSLELSLATGFLEKPASMRLSFREFGLSIGLKAAERLLSLIESNSEVYTLAKSLTGYKWIAEKIEGFWLNPSSMKSSSWWAHKDISMVMLATSLMPDEFLGVY
ncbi:MAG: hypothetical protein QXX56_05260 [Candidatus Bathyarchaeia archaeon]